MNLYPIFKREETLKFELNGWDCIVITIQTLLFFLVSLPVGVALVRTIVTVIHQPCWSKLRWRSIT